MTPVAAGRDPRSVVTPDAFEVSKALLGLRLAPPRRRLWALFTDLVVIAILTAVTRSFALILGILAAVLLIRAGSRRTPVRGSTFGRAMRGSVGCLGVLIGVTTIAVWVSLGPGAGGSRDDEVSSGEAANALDTGDAEPIASTPSEPIESRDAAAIRDEVSLYTHEEAVEAYAALLRSGRVEDMDVARRDALEARLTADLATDTVQALAVRIDELADDLDEAEEDLAETEAELDALESRGFFNTLRSFLDELGFGFGWASLYFTVMLTWWKGQTIGKRLLRIRVLRLDGGPITWWVAFERAGGYAAGIATGLLGFAQIYWDANRQAIHDRIVGTVVALDPPERVLDWESVP
jgi:hypothetical protein